MDDASSIRLHIGATDITPEDVAAYVREQRAEHLQTMVLTGWLVLIYGLVSLLLLKLPFLYFIAVVMGALVLGSTQVMLRNDHMLDGAVWTFLLGQIGVLGLLLWADGDATAIGFLMLIPMALTGLLLKTDEHVIVAGLAVGALFLGRLHHVHWLDALGDVILPAVVGSVLVLISYLMSRRNLTLVEWSLFAQDKSEYRAELFYRQQEELRQTLRELKIANLKLERLNAELVEARQVAENASQAKSVFLSNMSHELRTPLSAIVGYTSSMLSVPMMYDNQELPTVFREDVELVMQSGQYLSDLINDMLDLSKIEAGKLELYCAPVQLDEVINSVLATARGLLKGKPLQLRADLPEDLPPVWADSTRVRQILLNLISNAVKFTETGSVTVAVSVEGQMARVAVIDTGIGIPPDAQATIFDRYEQAAHDTQRQYGGTGLGLDISKQLAIMHGGDLTLHSEVGKGSTFAFTLPLTTETAISAEPDPGGIAIFAPNSDDLEAILTVLVIEDDSATRAMIRRALEEDGHAVIDTHSGAEGLALAAGLVPDLIVLDVFLGDEDGWEVLAALKADAATATVPVVVCTVAEDRHRALRLGAACFLPKPVTPAAVRAGIHNAVRAHT